MIQSLKVLARDKRECNDFGPSNNADDTPNFKSALPTYSKLDYIGIRTVDLFEIIKVVSCLF